MSRHLINGMSTTGVRRDNGNPGADEAGRKGEVALGCVSAWRSVVWKVSIVIW
jgi:hypothetical protein